jgi:antitoxin PrlF
MQATLTVTAKGQVTLRREVLEHLGVVPGDKIIIDLLPSGRAEVRAARAPGSIEGFIGCLYQPGTQYKVYSWMTRAHVDTRTIALWNDRIKHSYDSKRVALKSVSERTGELPAMRGARPAIG